MKPHGEFEIKIVGRVVEVKVIGTWNEDTAKEYVEVFKTVVVKLNTSPWGVLIDTTEWELGTPETEKIIADFMIWCMENNQRYESTIIGESELKKYQSNQYYQHLDTDVIDQRFFISIKEAIEWFSNIGLYKG
jgi:hypothetical protein